MKIAIVHPSLAIKGGAENAVAWLADELARREHSVSIFTSAYNDELFGGRRHKSYHVREIGGPGYSESTLMEMYRLARSLKQEWEGYDVVNAHNYPAYLWIYLARLRFPKTVWTCYEPPRNLYHSICNRHSTALISKGQAKSFTDYIRKQGVVSAFLSHPQALIPAKIRGLIQRPLDVHSVNSFDLVLPISKYVGSLVKDIYGPIEAKVCLLGLPTLGKECGVSKIAESHILTVSRLHPVKNVENVIHAVEILVDQGKFEGWQYIIVGSGPDEQRLRMLASELGLDTSVEFTGFVSEHELQDYYRRTRALIYMPLDEPFGLPFLEAAAFKKPVIGPNHGGPAELIVDGVTGFQVDPFNPDDIARALVVLLEDSQRAATMGSAGYERFMQQFTIEKYVDRFEEAVGIRSVRRE